VVRRAKRQKRAKRLAEAEPDGKVPCFTLSDPLPRGDAEDLAPGYHCWLTRVLDAARAAAR
jgi:hypothetical protein